MRPFLVIAAAAVVTAVTWGFVAGHGPAPERERRNVVEVGPEWYESLPADPEAATEAFLARVPAETRARGDAFSITRRIVIVSRLLVLAASVGFLLFSGAAAGMRDLARRVSARAPVQDAVFTAQMMLALFVLALPVETYAGFVRIRDAGLTRMTYAEWLGDAFLSWAVDTSFVAVGVIAVLALIRRRPQSWPAWGTAVYVALAAVYSLVAPVYIGPLFNTFEPLADGPEKREILSLARANDVPADDVFVRDASRQSELLNASVSGFAGTARIVLDDNTIAGSPASVTRMVMAHEIGHYVLAHVPESIVFEGAIMGAGIFLVALGARRLVARYGRRWQVDGLGDVGALPVLWGLFGVWGYVALPLTNAIDRQQEIEADLFGLNAAREPIAVGEFFLRDADAHALSPSAPAVWVFHSHPPPRDRILAAMRWRAENLTFPGAR